MPRNLKWENILQYNGAYLIFYPFIYSSIETSQMSRFLSLYRTHHYASEDEKQLATTQSANKRAQIAQLVTIILRSRLMDINLYTPIVIPSDSTGMQFYIVKKYSTYCRVSLDIFIDVGPYLNEKTGQLIHDRADNIILICAEYPGGIIFASCKASGYDRTIAEYIPPASLASLDFTKHYFGCLYDNHEALDIMIRVCEEICANYHEFCPLHN